MGSCLPFVSEVALVDFCEKFHFSWLCELPELLMGLCLLLEPSRCLGNILSYNGNLCLRKVALSFLLRQVRCIVSCLLQLLSAVVGQLNFRWAEAPGFPESWQVWEE